MSLARRVRELEKAGADLVDLGAGEPSFPSPRVAIEAAQRALDQGLTGYTQIDGRSDLRVAIAEHYGVRGAPWTGEGDTLVTIGAKAALFQLALALVDQGDEVVIPTPCWVSLPQQVELAGGRAILVPTHFEDEFEIRPEPILQALTERTRAVLVNSPCNPTGGIASIESLQVIAEACAERGLLLIADEAYERFVYDGRRHASVADLAEHFPETVVLVGSFSKSYAMTGWRIGYALGPKEVIAAARSVQSHATSNATSFAQPGALAALHSANEEAAAAVALCQKHRDLVVESLNSIPGVRCASPRGSFYAFPDVSGRFTAQCADGSALAEQLLNEAGVVLVPGAAFGDDRYLRLSFAASTENVERGLDRISRAWR